MSYTTFPSAYSYIQENPFSNAPQQTKSQGLSTKWDNDSNRGTIAKANRYCLECLTKSTPEWRSGPQGSATLCNACGLRYARKLKAGIVSSQSATVGPVEVVREQSSVLSMTNPQACDEGNAPYSDPLASVAERMDIQRFLNFP